MISIELPIRDQSGGVIDTTAGRLFVPSVPVAARTIAVDPVEIATLIGAACAAAERAYTPYSKFRVGAAVIMADDPDGHLFTGANVENGSYSLTICGERSALFGAVSAGFRRLKYLAVSTVDSLDEDLERRSPCGACRQVMREFAAVPGAVDETLIFVDNGRPDRLCDLLTIDCLLPFAFTA